MTRPLYAIAKEILEDMKAQCPPPKSYTTKFYASLPYVRAMRELSTLKDPFGYDTAQSVVLYFLSNANVWRGETAKRVKQELWDLLKAHGYRR